MAMTPAEKQRAYRERKRAAAEAERAAQAAERNAEPGTAQRDAVESTIAAAKWLTGTDAASIAQARMLARRIDVLDHEGDVTKALSAHRALSQVLNDLGLTATKRMQYELRSAKATTSAGEGDGERKSSEGTPSNVTKLERPARRAR